MPNGERTLLALKKLRSECQAVVERCDKLISSKEAAEKAMAVTSASMQPAGSVAFKMLDTQGEKTMQNIDAAKRRKDLLEGRDSCKALLASIEKELAGDSEDGAAKSAGAIEFHSPDMKTAILEARSQPAFKSASVALR
jgi:hypothetical protein